MTYCPPEDWFHDWMDDAELRSIEEMEAREEAAYKASIARQRLTALAAAEEEEAAK
jgi:hypothetical protein